MEYTKGEWYLDEYDEHYDLRCNCGNGLDIDIAYIFKHKSEANAHLIAASPKLYEALKIIVNRVIATGASKIGDEVLLANKALAKAEGKSSST